MGAGGRSNASVAISLQGTEESISKRQKYVLFSRLKGCAAFCSLFRTSAEIISVENA